MRNLPTLLALLTLALVACSSPSSLPLSPPADTTATSAAVAPTATPTSGAASPVASQVGVHCGTERWPVKTLSDPDAAHVDFNPVNTTVTKLRSTLAPSSLPQSSRIAPTELTVFSVTAQLLDFKLEEDRDIHLVIADPSDPSATMIVEFPNADQCSGAITSAHAEDMKAARAALVAGFGQPHSSGFTHLSGTATVTGIGFFDFLHGQRGVAPNGIELHPVLAFSGAAQQPPVIPASTQPPASGCDPSYPDFCIPPPPPDLDCGDIAQKTFTVLPPDPHRFDGDHDGIGCET